MNLAKKILLFLSVLLSGFSLSAQPYIADDITRLAEAPAALGITILSNPSLSIKSVSDYQNGVSINHNTLQLSVSPGLSWSLQVRATDDLRYQTYSIPISAIGIQSLNLGNRPEVLLSTANQTLSSGLASSLLTIVNQIQYRAVGGSNFLQPGGAYTTTLVFTYTAL